MIVLDNLGTYMGYRRWRLFAVHCITIIKIEKEARIKLFMRKNCVLFFPVNIRSHVVAHPLSWPHNTLPCVLNSTKNIQTYILYKQDRLYIVGLNDLLWLTI